MNKQMQTVDYGRVSIGADKLILTGEAVQTGRLLPAPYRNRLTDGVCDVEWVACGRRLDGTPVRVFWVHAMTADTEPDTLNWDVANRAESD